MKILEHPESHIVKLDDGSTWQIFPGDIDHTLSWLPTTELRLFEMNDGLASHALINSDDGTHVRMRPQGERWPVEKVEDVLKQGYNSCAAISSSACISVSIGSFGAGFVAITRPPPK